MHRRVLSALIVLCTIVVQVRAQESAAQPAQQGSVTYLTSTTAYVDLGSNHGFDVGDTLHVEAKQGGRIATLVVTNIASKSMATTIVARTAPFTAGDRVTGVPRHTPRLQRATLLRDSTAAAVQVQPRADSSAARTPRAQTALPAASPTSGSESPTLLHGRVSLQYYGLTSSTTKGFDFSQPAVVLSLSAENILDLPLQFSMYSNHRYDARPASRVPSNVPKLQNRVYQFAFQYGTMTSPFAATVGRFIAPAVGGVGTFDGAMFVSRHGIWEAGLVAGSQPGYQSSEFTTADPKAAAYVGCTTGDYAGTRYQGSFAYAQTYKSGALDRGFFYMQNSLSFGSLISLYQNANLDMYDLKNGRSASGPHLSDMFVSSTWRPLRWLSVSGSWAVRRNIWFMRSYAAIPDSLFDRSMMNNLQLSVGMNLPMAMYVSVSGSTRTKEGDAQSANALQGRWSWSNVLDSETNLYLSGSWADNIYSKSTSYGLEVNRDVIADLYVSVRAQRYAYSFTSGSRTLDRSTLGVDAYWRIGKTLYASISVERAWEGAVTSNRWYGDVSWRW